MSPVAHTSPPATNAIPATMTRLSRSAAQPPIRQTVTVENGGKAMENWRATTWPTAVCPSAGAARAGSRMARSSSATGMPGRATANSAAFHGASAQAEAIGKAVQAEGQFCRNQPPTIIARAEPMKAAET